MSVLVRELAPTARLRPVIEAVYLAAATRPARHAVLPDGCVDLLYRYGDAGGLLLIAGPDRRVHEAALAPGLRYVGARFRLGEARRILGLEPAGLVDRGLVPAAVNARLAAVEGRLADCRTPAALARRLCSEIERLDDETAALRPPPRVRAALALLRPDGQVLRIGLVARRLGVAPRTLHREIVAWTGLRPCLLARILRFQHTRRSLAARTGTLAALAAAAGYADQAHMTRESQALAGAPPGRFGSSAR